MATAEQKSEFVAAAHRHRAADMLVKGIYVDTEGSEFHGCSVGCMLRDARPELSLVALCDVKNKHREVAEHFGYPEWLALLQDTIFEGLPSPGHLDWHVQFGNALRALPDDIDWQAALHRVHAAILRISYRTAGSAQAAAQTVLDLHERAARGEDVSDELWSAAESAESAAWSAARSAARSAAYRDLRDAILAALPEASN